jgi:hypothetical protein
LIDPRPYRRNLMLLHVAACERKARNALTTSAPEPPFYADDLLPALQSTLASLADVDVRYEIERDYLEEWSGPEEVRQRLIAALEAGWRRDREPIVQRLARVEKQIRAPRPAYRPESATHKDQACSEPDGAPRRFAA